jgi:hypothetical protein
LAGTPVPQNVRAAIFNVPGPSSTNGIASSTNANVNAATALQQPPARFPVSAPSQFARQPFANQFPNLGLLPPSVPQFHQPYNSASPWYAATSQQLGYPGYQLNYNQTIPVYSPQRHQNIPSCVSNTQLGRDTHQYDGYQISMTNDLFAINQYDPAFQSGEPLFLPCNFISHVRGSARSEDEELFRTSSGTKLYLGQGGMKNKPEKLSYGLFFGANARILARLVPNLTPDLACYLDYLRKIGDLMLNFTASSVFLLDHKHRFEVVEQPDKKWNQIDQALCMNVLKKREQPMTTSTTNNYSSATRQSLNIGTNSSQQRTVCRTTVICILFNSHEGCSYGTGCRFMHVCNIVGCGLEHPAFKHSFRGPSAAGAVQTPTSSVTK